MSTSMHSLQIVRRLHSSQLSNLFVLERIFHDEISLLNGTWLCPIEEVDGHASTTSVDSVSSKSFRFSMMFSLSDQTKPLKVGHSDTADRPYFDDGSCMFLTVSSTPETPDSWSLRPALMGLGPTSVSGRVVEENGFRNHLL